MTSGGKTSVIRKSGSVAWFRVAEQRIDDTKAVQQYRHRWLAVNTVQESDWQAGRSRTT